LAFLARNRRTWFGLAAMGLFLLPVLFLPGRMFSAYCYLPFAGLAIALTGLAEAASPAALALFLALWLPVDLYELRLRRRDTLTNDNEVRTWMSGVRRFAAGRERVDAFVFSGTPAGFQDWGVVGALRYFYGRSDLTVKDAGDAGAAALTETRRVAFLKWDAGRKRLDIVLRGPGGY
jgi:hypothetical protein